MNDCQSQARKLKGRDPYIAFRAPDRTNTTLRSLAAKRGVSISRIIRDALDLYLNQVA